MKNNVIRIIILCLLLIILMILTVVVYKNVFEKSEVDTLIINEDNEVEGEVEEETKEDINEDTTSKEENNSNESVTVNENSNSTSYNENNNVYVEETKVDNRDAVTYFEDKEREVNSGGTLEDFKGKFKNYFIEIVDFIFYDKEINGYTFDSLSNSAKLKVISTALKIDSMIDNKVPGYKETIWSSGNKIYSNVKERLVTLYLDTATKVCENRGEECDKAKETFSEVKSKCKIGWSFIKSLASTSKDKLKSWYEVYSGK